MSRVRKAIPLNTKLALHIVLLIALASGTTFSSAVYSTSPLDGLFIGPESAQLFVDMGKIENQLYGHPYEDQSISKRLSRVEKTLFGSPQGGKSEDRFKRLQAKIQQQQDAKTTADQGPMIDYLEQKFFSQTYPNLPFEQRLHQLELQVFGKPFDKSPIAVRLKKLTYTVPLMAKEIRLTKQGTVMASSKQKSTPTTATAFVPVMADDFFDNLYKLPNNKILRWTSLPVQVYIESGSSTEERDLIAQAVTTWNMVFPMRVVPIDSHADILVDWHNAAMPIGPLTQPILHLDQQKNIRTVVLVNMTPYKSMAAPQKLRASLHQLGHAAGIWGHSEDPQDVMYPGTAWESADIPRRWNQKPFAPSGETPSGFQPAGLSSRDKNTMLQLYSHPAQDMRAYSLP